MGGIPFFHLRVLEWLVWSEGPVRPAEGRTGLIPIVISIDAEADSHSISATARSAWSGFEKAQRVAREWKSRIVAATGRPAHFNWLLRMDVQMEAVYGSAGWLAKKYPAWVEERIGDGDDVGLHVHPYRLAGDQWIGDFGDQAFVERNLRIGHSAFCSALGRKPATFSMGNNWLNQPTVGVLEELGVQYDLSLIAGACPARMSDVMGDSCVATGTRPDFTSLPRTPFRPAPDNLAQADPGRSEGLWIFPISGVLASDPLRRAALRLLRLKRDPSRMRKLLLGLGAGRFGPDFDQWLDSCNPALAIITLRAHQFVQNLPRLEESLNYLLLHPLAENFAFVTPAEALVILGLETRNGNGSRQART